MIIQEYKILFTFFLRLQILGLMVWQQQETTGTQ